MSGSRFISPQSCVFLVILVRQLSLSYDIITLSRILNKVNLMEKGQFRGHQKATYLASNCVKFGMSQVTFLHT